ncbi:hypothetical protein EYF80_027923 [Liparis tanakae]|uniref:Uncharacterized protein n=1 Tax=Liparis tanakae TaxID=230148 RepID=A0A4Z2H7M2_9TELE|nr:hypothetical protein EYF80_027923 [Liparis tanakae]
MENGMTTVKAVNNKGNVTHAWDTASQSVRRVARPASSWELFCSFRVRLIRPGRRNQRAIRESVVYRSSPKIPEAKASLYSAALVITSVSQPALVIIPHIVWPTEYLHRASLVPAKVPKGPDYMKAKRRTTAVLEAEIHGQPPPDAARLKDGDDVDEDDKDRLN